ncbi:Sodium/hydrogen exchanger 8 [Chlorella vulgaris]
MSEYLDVSFAGNTSEECFGFSPAAMQVACSAQLLNITDPPSIYSWEEDSFLWEPVTCMLANVTYSNRIDLADNFNWCSVPLKGSDAFLFVSLALVTAAALFGKLSAVWVLISGGVIGAINNYANLLQVSNSISIWLGISPPDLFFYALWVHILTLAFVMVILSAIILTPIILFGLGFASRGFTWVHGALFAAMIASTDALAATAILKAGGGPEKLVVLMEGEALLNDASAITLFEVFMHILEDHPTAEHMPTVWSAIPTIIEEILKLASIGAGVGLGMSIATGYLLRWLRWRGAKPAVEITVILAVAYMSFYGSGVISVVVFGLWGNYTSNSIDILGGNAWSYAAIPLIYVFMLLIRTGCLALFNISVFAWIRERLGWTEVLFTGWSGLRGSISLIMTADFIAHSVTVCAGAPTYLSCAYVLADRVNSDIAIWTASFVVLTLVINAPSISLMMRWLKLDRITPEKQAMRAKAKRALMRFTGAAIGTLREDDEEFLQGANWQAVGRYVDVSDALKKFDPPLPPAQAWAISAAAPPGSKQSLPGGEADAKGGEATLARKSVGQSVSEALRVPLSPFMSTQRDGGTSDGGAETDASRRSGSRFRNVFRPSTAHAQLGQTSEETRERAGRSRQRRQRDAAGRPFTSGAGFDSDKESSSSDAGESDSSGYRSDASSGAGGGKGGAPAGTTSHGAALHALFDDSDSDALEGLVEECPFIQAKQPRQPHNSAEEQREQVPAADAPASEQGDIEMGLRSTAAAVEALTGAAAEAGAAAATGFLAAAIASVAAAGGLTGQEATPAGGTSAVPSPTAALAPASAAAAADGDHEQSAEGLAFIRQRQQSQRQRRPALGSIFGVAESDAAQQAAPPDSPVGLSGSGLPRASSLRAIAENQPELPGQAGAWHQQVPAPDSHATSAHGSEAGGGGDHELYSSSLPAAVGQQLKQQLRMHQLQQASPDATATTAPGDSNSDTATAGTDSNAGLQRGGGGSADDLYYSSMPAAAGRQMALQLQQELQAGIKRPPTAEGPAAVAEPRVSLAGGTSAAAAGVPASDDQSVGYYSSVPAAVGRQMALQLKQEQLKEGQAQQEPPTAALAAAATSRDESHGRPPLSPPDNEHSSAAYYSSVPAAVGRRMAEQLKQEQLKQEEQQASPIAAAAATGSLQEATGQPGASGLTQEAAADYYSSLPAAAGRTLQLQLRQQLAGAEQQPSPATEAEAGGREPSKQPAAAAAAAAGRHVSARRLARQASPAQQLQQKQQRGWEEYHRTVTGAAGPSLAAELQRQLAQNRAATAAEGAMAPAPLLALPEHDLLGRRVSSSSSAAEPTSVAWEKGPTLGGDVFARVPLSARSAYNRPSPMDPSRHALHPAAGGLASLIPGPTSVSASLQMRRERAMDRSRKPGDGSGSSRASISLAPSGTSADGPFLRTSSGVQGGLTTRSVDMPADRDTSWQHKPVRAARVLTRTSPGLTSINSMPPAVPAGSEGIASGDPFLGPAVGMAPQSLPQAHSSAAPSSAGGGAKGVRAQAALARFSMAGSAGSSMHGASAYETAAAAAVAAAGGPAAFVPSGSGNHHFSDGVLSEMRSRLIAGLKRYFHAKRLEGLLSVQGLRILEYACDYAAEHTLQSLSVWKLLEKEIAGNLTTRIMARCLMLLARGWRSSPRWLQIVTSWPVKKVSGFLRRLLGQRMLVSCEVAVEYYLSMVHSPQIQWLQQADEAWPLQQEVEAEVDAAYKFIIDREIEAPDRFQAIQSYRAAMAVLRQQLTFVHELFESGMVDEGEKDDMVAPLDKRMRHLEITGPVWKPPRPRAVLRSLPFMQPLPEEMFRVILRAGSIKEQKTGVAFWSSSNLPAVSGLESGPGVYVVLSGVIRRLHQHLDGTVKEYFQGTGGVVGSLLALTGTRLPGNETAVAEGNTLGKGPTLFHVPQSAVFEVLQREAAGSKPAAMLHLQLLRGAAAYVCESCESDVVHALHLHLLQLAVARMLRSRKSRPSRHFSGLAGGGAPTATSMPRVSTESGVEQQQQQQQREQPKASPVMQRKSVSGEQELGLRRTSSLSRLSSWQLQQQRNSGAAAMATQREGDVEEVGPLRRQASMSSQLARQAMPAPGGLGLRHAKSFGGHLAELMQQIATEEFEQMEAREQHMGKVDEGDEDEASLASPNPSGSTGAGLGLRGNSSHDLQTTAAADGTPSGVPQPPLPASNGHAAAHDSQQFGVPEQAYSDTVTVAAMKAASKSMRQSARAAERRAPQYAVEVLAEFKRGITSGILLRLPAGQTFRQTTHAVLLRGQLHAVGPPLAADNISPASSAQHSKEQLSNSRLDAAFSGGTGSKSPHRSSSTREVDWEAGLAKMAAAAACPAAPQLLPWLCNPRYRCNSGARLPTEQLWQAGPGGAQLLVCLTDGGEVPDGVQEAEASAAAAAADAAPAVAAPGVELGRPSVVAHPLDLPSASSSQRGQGVEGAMRAAGESAVRSATRVASIAAAPAAMATNSLMNFMPWQHRYSRSSTATSSEAGTNASAADNSVPGSDSNVSAFRRGNVVVSLERLASRRSDGLGRSVSSAR